MFVLQTLRWRLDYTVCVADPAMEMALDARIRKIQADNEARMERHRLVEKEKKLFFK